jgi:hypothetical protein
MPPSPSDNNGWAALQLVFALLAAGLLLYWLAGGVGVDNNADDADDDADDDDNNANDRRRRRHGRTLLQRLTGANTAAASRGPPFHKGMARVPASRRREVTFLCRDLPDKQAAADLLVDLTHHLQRFVRRLHRAYPDDARVTRLHARFNPNAVYELEAHSKMTSYSFNKGEYIVFCIRSRDEHNKLAPMNILVFVGLHELAHVMTLTKGHDEAFWENFRFLLAHAIKWGYYKDIDYASNPRPYCGTYITDTPLRVADSGKYITYDEAVDREDPLDPDIHFEAAS